MKQEKPPLTVEPPDGPVTRGKMRYAQKLQQQEARGWRQICQLHGVLTPRVAKRDMLDMGILFYRGLVPCVNIDLYRSVSMTLHRVVGFKKPQRRHKLRAQSSTQRE